MRRIHHRSWKRQLLTCIRRQVRTYLTIAWERSTKSMRRKMAASPKSQSHWLAQAIHCKTVPKNEKRLRTTESLSGATRTICPSAIRRQLPSVNIVHARLKFPTCRNEPVRGTINQALLSKKKMINRTRYWKSSSKTVLKRQWTKRNRLESWIFSSLPSLWTRSKAQAMEETAWVQDYRKGPKGSPRKIKRMP